MADLQPTDQFLVNRDGTTYTQQQDTLMANLETNDLLLVNRSDTTYTITGEELIESVIDPFELVVAINPTNPELGVELTATSVPSGGKKPDGGYVFTYQWYQATDIDGGAAVPISGETTATYTPDNADEDKFVGCKVTTQDALGTAAEDTAYVGPVTREVQAPVIASVLLTEIQDGTNRYTSKEFPYTTTMSVDGEPDPTYEAKVKLSGAAFEFNVKSDAITSTANEGAPPLEMAGTTNLSSLDGSEVIMTDGTAGADGKFQAASYTLQTSGIVGVGVAKSGLSDGSQEWSANASNSWTPIGGDATFALSSAFDGSYTTNAQTDQAVGTIAFSSLSSGKVSILAIDLGPNDLYYTINGVKLTASNTSEVLVSGSVKRFTYDTPVALTQIQQINDTGSSTSLSLVGVEVDGKILRDGPWNQSEVWSSVTSGDIYPGDPGDGTTGYEQWAFNGNLNQGCQSNNDEKGGFTFYFASNGADYGLPNAPVRVLVDADGGGKVLVNSVEVFGDNGAKTWVDCGTITLDKIAVNNGPAPSNRSGTLYAVEVDGEILVDKGLGEVILGDELEFATADDLKYFKRGDIVQDPDVKVISTDPANKKMIVDAGGEWGGYNTSEDWSSKVVAKNGSTGDVLPIGTDADEWTGNANMFNQDPLTSDSYRFGGGTDGVTFEFSGISIVGNKYEVAFFNGGTNETATVQVDGGASVSGTTIAGVGTFIDFTQLMGGGGLAGRAIKCTTTGSSLGISGWRIDGKLLVDGPWDQSQTWSDTVFTENSTTFNATCTGRTGFSSPPENGFNGDLTNFANGWGLVESWVYWTPTQPITDVTSLEIFTQDAGGIALNGLGSFVAVTPALTTDSTSQWYTVTSPPSSLTQIAVQGTTVAGSSGRFGGIKINGELYVDPTVGGQTEISYGPVTGTGTVSSVSGTTVAMTTDGAQDNRFIGTDNAGGKTFYIADKAGVPITVSDAWGTTQIVGNKLQVTGIQQDEPAYTAVTAKDYTVKFPATFATGNAPDTDLPLGTSIAVKVKATNSEGNSEKESNLVMPKNPNPSGAAGVITASTPTTITVNSSTNLNTFRAGDDLVMVDINNDIVYHDLETSEITNVDITQVTQFKYSGYVQNPPNTIANAVSLNSATWNVGPNNNVNPDWMNIGDAMLSNNVYTYYSRYEFPKPTRLSWGARGATNPLNVSYFYSDNPDGPWILDSTYINDGTDIYSVNSSTYWAVVNASTSPHYTDPDSVPTGVDVSHNTNSWVIKSIPTDPTLTFTDDQDLRYFRPGDVVGPNPTGYSDMIEGQASVSVEGNTLSFDGDITTNPGYYGGLGQGNPFIFTPLTPIEYTTSVRVALYNVSDESLIVNGDTVNQIACNALGWTNVLTGAGTITSLQMTRSSSTHGWAALEIDGTILVDADNAPKVISTDVGANKMVVSGGEWGNPDGDTEVKASVTGTAKFVSTNGTDEIVVEQSNDHFIDNTNRQGTDYYVRDDITVLYENNPKHKALQQAVAEAFIAFPKNVAKRKASIKRSFTKLLKNAELSKKEEETLQRIMDAGLEG